MRASRTNRSRKRRFSDRRGGTTLTATFFSNPSSPRKRQRYTPDIPPEAIFRRTEYFPGRPWTIRLPLPSFLRDSQLLHLPVNAGAVQAQFLGRAAHVEVVSLEFPREELLLEREHCLPEILLVEHLHPRRGRLRGHRLGGENALHGLLPDRGTHRKDQKALHDVAQFADVPRPWVREEPLHRFPGTRRIFACVRGLMSPTSSRKRVPPSASSKRPLLRPVAPVNAPFSCPNSSDSISSSGIAAQFTATNGRVALLLC